MMFCFQDLLCSAMILMLPTGEVPKPKVPQAPCDGRGAASTAWSHKQWQLNLRKKGFTLRVARPWGPQSSWFFHPSVLSNYTSPGSALGYLFLAVSEYTFSLLPLPQNPWRQWSAAVCLEFVSEENTLKPGTFYGTLFPPTYGVQHCPNTMCYMVFYYLLYW